MTAFIEYGVMHPGGQMLADENRAGYPFTSRRMAYALASDLDDDCDCGDRGHVVMERRVGDWFTPAGAR